MEDKADIPRSERIDDVEKDHVATDITVEPTKFSGLKLDRNGLPLVPQPSDHADDPLVSFSPFVALESGINIFEYRIGPSSDGCTLLWWWQA